MDSFLKMTQSKQVIFNLVTSIMDISMTELLLRVKLFTQAIVIVKTAFLRAESTSCMLRRF